MKSQIIVLLSLFFIFSADALPVNPDCSSWWCFGEVVKDKEGHTVDAEPLCSSWWWKKATREAVRDIEDVNKKCTHGRRLIHVALGVPEVGLATVNELLLMGAQVHAKNDSGHTPLHVVAYKHDRPELVESLIRFGADVGALDGYKGTPLQLLLMTLEANPPMVAVFLKHGADVHARNVYLQTPLHSAVRYQKNAEVIKPLLDAGADVHAKDRVGFTPLELAHIYAPQEIIDLLERFPLPAIR